MNPNEAIWALPALASDPWIAGPLADAAETAVAALAPDAEDSDELLHELTYEVQGRTG
ncbi:hypothetical protein ACF07T_39155 [Streptomyces sp. NPDC015184]|uniref:hypothetical protein n=1 Tax=Streptomyces sp. NPDC015184 TaxID=3364946 RepID=UPI0036FCE851